VIFWILSRKPEQHTAVKNSIFPMNWSISCLHGIVGASSRHVFILL
jgi:hypothetical protein